VTVQRTDRTLRNPLPIWVVRVGDDLYVRSYKGTGSLWYRGIQATRAGHIQSGSVDKDVTFVDEADPAIGDAIDAAYRDKYRSYGAGYVDPMLAATARGATLKLVPRLVPQRGSGSRPGRARVACGGLPAGRRHGCIRKFKSRRTGMTLAPELFVP
jgi:hypothetical protein